MFSNALILTQGSKNDLFSVTIHIALSLVSLSFGALLCYVLFIILGIYLSPCILLYNALILTQGSVRMASKALIMTQGCILLSEIILRALRGVL